MKIATYPIDFEHAIKLGNEKVTLLVGNDKFSTRIPNSFTIDEISKLIGNDFDVEVLVNHIYHEGDIDCLVKYLTELSSMGIKKVRFSDLAVITICGEENIKFELTYDPETLITSYGVFDFWTENGISTLQVARELFPNELADMIKNKKDMKLSIQIHGKQFMMQSKRALIKNYADNFGYDLDSSKPMTIREETRTAGNVIYEDAKGTTNLFTDYDLVTIKHLDLISKFDTLVINNLFHDKDWTDRVIEIYKNALSGEEKDGYKKLEEISDTVSEGFFNPGVNAYERE